MKATGIVRRIDDLGRVVIPKEIRRTLRIREGDPLEIFTDREGEIILKNILRSENCLHLPDNMQKVCLRRLAVWCVSAIWIRSLQPPEVAGKNCRINISAGHLRNFWGRENRWQRHTERRNMFRLQMCQGKRMHMR